MANVNPLQFFRQVKQEVKKVTWPSKKEVVQSLVMVIALVAITATFFFVVDQVLSWIVKLVFSIGE
ncbi:MAG: preprotein translocase subunit SecE [Alphaproteobacteria bacterium]|nr:preprotein translocase subunit SecE [Alphaproteobacteria bacterium]